MCSFRDVDKVHDLMDDISEQQELSNEISEAISNPVGFGQDVDEVRIYANQCLSFKPLFVSIFHQHFNWLII